MPDPVMGVACYLLLSSCLGVAFTQDSDPTEAPEAPADCGAPQEVQNGAFDSSGGTLLGATSVLRCNAGFRLGKKECAAAGWQNKEPECEVVTCSKPAAVENGAFSPEKDIYAYGANVTYSCNVKYKVKGSSVVWCVGDGTFVPDAPQCSKGTTYPVPLGIILGISGTVLFLQIFWM